MDRQMANALDSWLTTEPYWRNGPMLVTEETYYGMHDLQINELRCAWTNKLIGYTDYQDENGYQLHFTDFYQLDPDGEVLVERETYESREEE